jgi:hypothetical protein
MRYATRRNGQTGRRPHQRALVDARLPLGIFTSSGSPDEIMQGLRRCRPGAFRLPRVVADFRTPVSPAIDD